MQRLSFGLHIYLDVALGLVTIFILILQLCLAEHSYGFSYRSLGISHLNTYVGKILNRLEIIGQCKVQ